MADDPHKALKGRLKLQQEDMEEARRDHTTRWTEIGAWFAPRRNFVLDREPGALRQRRIVDTTAVISGERLAALLQGYMMSPYEPWVAPMLLTSRDPSREEDEWFEATQNDMHRFLTGSQSSFRTASYETTLDAVIFGNGVQEGGRARAGGRIVYKSVPLNECYWRENDDAVIDVLHRKFKLPLHQAAAQFPNSKVAAKLTQQKTNPRERFTFIRAVEPRSGGFVAAAGVNKPFASITYCEETDEIVSISGYDDFPYQVFRIARQAGETYGTGFGWHAYPLHRLLNAMEETIMHAGDLNAQPPLLDMTGKLKTLDRRPGAVNSITAAEAMLMSDGDLIKRLHEPGDVTVGVELIRDIRRQIEMIFYIDWMSLRDGPQMTATEVNERRDIRLRSMTPLVARGENEYLNATAERTFNLMQRGNMLRPPPASLAGVEIGWKYSSPLAMAQRQSTLEAINKSLIVAQAIITFDEEARHVPNFKEMLREAMGATGLPVKFTNSPKDVKKAIDADREQKDRDRQLLEAQAAAGAARDAGQAAGSFRAAA